MPAKPYKDHASRTAAIFALRREGKTEREIATLLGVRPNTVTAMEARARARALLPAQVVRVSSYVAADLDREARKRGTTVDQLTTAILHAIVVDKLFGAVLDQ